ncbi:MAG: DEAD/DEAH box helicase [Gammaproteobacteria bacterium]|nr:DEAD/DEAH box helicase [Gammaproteobacteria bacterium]
MGLISGMNAEDGGMPEVTSFGDMSLSPETLAAVEALGWRAPTPVQRRAIPPGLEGRDIVGIAQTGTGKTGAFLLPVLEGAVPGEGLQALVLCPTRELAQQVLGDAVALSRGRTLRCAAIVGGVGYGPQRAALDTGTELIAATPGRFIDHMRRGQADLARVRFLVLDEADRMLDMGFRPQIESVLRKVPRKRQTMLFSATMPHGVHALSLQVTRDPVRIEVAPSGTTAEGIDERVYSVKPGKKEDLLVRLLADPDWNHVLVFTRTKRGADMLLTRLQREGISVDVMHSDRQMRHRVRALDRFATGGVRVLVATDIAQRGLDVEGISHVVNYDIPLDPGDYVHRIGRTARAGAAGTAVSFLTAPDLAYLKSIELLLGRTLERIHLPEFDYAGTPVEQREEGARRRHPRSARGFGSKSAETLSPEELERLLGRSSQ